MAIKGTVEMEDTFVSWTDEAPEGVEMAGNCLFIAVKDEPTGVEWSGVVNGPEFMAAMSIALSWEGDGRPDDWAQAEIVMGLICAEGRDILRFIP